MLATIDTMRSLPFETFLRGLALATCAVLTAAPAVAQTLRAPQTQTPDAPVEPDGQEDDAADDAGPAWLEGKFGIHFNGGYQGGSHRVTDTFAFRAYGEDARFSSAMESSGGGLFDIGGSLLVWRDLSVGASYTQLTGSSSATVTGNMPHPIEFDSPRTITPQSLSLTHEERAGHIFGAWRVPVQQVEHLDVSIFGGLSLFNVTQGVVTNVTVSEPGGPPFASVTVDQVQTGEYRKNGVGGHVGVDVTYMFSDHVGAGFLARFAGGSVDLPSGTVSLSVGGMQIGGGVRFRF